MGLAKGSAPRLLGGQPLEEAERVSVTKVFPFMDLQRSFGGKAPLEVSGPTSHAKQGWLEPYGLVW